MCWPCFFHSILSSWKNHFEIISCEWFQNWTAVLGRPLFSGLDLIFGAKRYSNPSFWPPTPAIWVPDKSLLASQTYLLESTQTHTDTHIHTHTHTHTHRHRHTKTLIHNIFFLLLVCTHIERSSHTHRKNMHAHKHILTHIYTQI